MAQDQPLWDCTIGKLRHQREMKWGERGIRRKQEKKYRVEKSEENNETSDNRKNKCREV